MYVLVCNECVLSVYAELASGYWKGYHAVKISDLEGLKIVK